MPNIDDQETLRELVELRRGRGLLSPRLRIGPSIATACGIRPEMSTAEARDRLTARIDAELGSFPQDLGLAVRAALALPPAPPHPFLAARMEWLGKRLDRDPRTARRRVDDGISLLAERFVGVSAPHESGNPFAPGGWYVASLSAALQLERDPVRLLETRTIVCTQEGLRELTVSWSVPAASQSPTGLTVDVQYGGNLVKNDRTSTATYWSGAIVLPQPMRVGDRHEYSVHVTALPLDLMNPFYVVTPHRRIDEFRLHTRFPRSPSLEGVWQVDGVPFQLLDEGDDIQGVLVEPNAAGEVTSHFRELQLGLSYGLRWRRASPAEPVCQSP